jgi:aminomethyltransferase
MTSPTPHLDGYRFAVKAIEQTTKRPLELARTMLPHPLSYQELAHDPEYVLYNGRLTPSAFSDVSDDEMYWKVRREVILRHTGELPIEIVGPDAERLLDHVFARDVSKVQVGRCSYQFACYHDGGLINDGVLLRLAEDRFWMAQADGDLLNWYRAHAVNDDGSPMEVKIFDPGVWVSQVQGPRSLEVLEAVIDGPMPERFNYFDTAEVSIAGQPVVIGRSGFTNELGWEFYLTPNVNITAVGDHILSIGEAFGMIITGVGVFQARRIEAGLLNAGSDFDGTTTPFAAGLGGFVDFDKGDFIGRAALLNADRSCRTWGLRTNGGVADLGDTLSVDGQPAGRVCSGGWSPYQQCGVAIVRMEDATFGPGAAVEVVCADGETRSGDLCTLPMFDPERLIPRGKLVDIPEVC